MQRPFITPEAFLVYLDMELSRFLIRTGIFLNLIGIFLLLYSCATNYKIQNYTYQKNNITPQSSLNQKVNTVYEDYKKSYKAAKKIHKWITPFKWNCIYKYSTLNNISPGLTAAVIWHESEGKEWAKGPYVEGQGRAHGLMQVMPKYHYKGNERDLLNIETNIRIGTKVLSKFIRREKGNLVKALKDYNSGPGSTYYNKPYIKGILKQYSEYKNNLFYEI